MKIKFLALALFIYNTFVGIFKIKSSSHKFIPLFFNPTITYMFFILYNLLKSNLSSQPISFFC